MSFQLARQHVGRLLLDSICCKTRRSRAVQDSRISCTFCAKNACCGVVSGGRDGAIKTRLAVENCKSSGLWRHGSLPNCPCAKLREPTRCGAEIPLQNGFDRQNRKLMRSPTETYFYGAAIPSPRRPVLEVARRAATDRSTHGTREKSDSRRDRRLWRLLAARSYPPNRSQSCPLPASLATMPARL